jgi:hypothetical protein
MRRPTTMKPTLLRSMPLIQVVIGVDPAGVVVQDADELNGAGQERDRHRQAGRRRRGATG